MREHTFTLATGDTYTFREKGSYFVVKSTTAPVTLSTPDGRIRLTGIEDGQGIRGVPFSDILITATTGATLTVVAGDAGEIIDTVQVAGAVSVAPTDTLTAGTATVGGTATTIAAVTGQKKITIKCADANSGTVTIGTVSGTGLTFGAGSGITIETSAALPLIASTSGQVVEYLQES